MNELISIIITLSQKIYLSYRGNCGLKNVIILGWGAMVSHLYG